MVFFYFFEGPPYCFPQLLHQFAFPGTLHKCSLCATSSATVATSCIFHHSPFNRCEVYLTVVLICISLTTALISHKGMLKILQARLQEYVNRELPDVQAGFRKGRGTRDQIANIRWIIEKAREFQKKISISALLTMPKPLTVWIAINCGKF